ncbi:HAD family hydrolase [Candidatus Saccharibacteria bacterium]|jgi:FMN phosphatase YigB (HAD superfamily)|nr:HAD family hydrolase [Candidatus Saccharibacteria bacterium]
MQNNIQHIWFDMDGTLTIHTDKFHKVHNDLRYKAYSDVTGKPINNELIKNFEKLYAEHGSNSETFASLGKPSGFWMKYFGQIDQTLYYEPIPKIYETLNKLRETIPISVFTNNKLVNILRTFGVVNIDLDWFTHIISGDDIVSRKPALDGFNLIIEKSNVPANNILYVGDRVKVDVLPANELGMQSCLLYGNDDRADYCLEKFSQLLDLPIEV